MPRTLSELWEDFLSVPHPANDYSPAESMERMLSLMADAKQGRPSMNDRVTQEFMGAVIGRQQADLVIFAASIAPTVRYIQQALKNINGSESSVDLSFVPGVSEDGNPYYLLSIKKMDWHGDISIYPAALKLAEDSQACLLIAEQDPIDLADPRAVAALFSFINEHLPETTKTALAYHLMASAANGPDVLVGKL